MPLLPTLHLPTPLLTTLPLLMLLLEGPAMAMLSPSVSFPTTTTPPCYSHPAPLAPLLPPARGAGTPAAPAGGAGSAAAPACPAVMLTDQKTLWGQVWETAVLHSHIFTLYSSHRDHGELRGHE